jgi:hypothetical protein
MALSLRGYARVFRRTRLRGGDEITLARAPMKPRFAERLKSFSELVGGCWRPASARQHARSALSVAAGEMAGSGAAAGAGEIEPGIVRKCVYSQVPAFAAGDRGMLDLLTVDAGTGAGDRVEGRRRSASALAGAGLLASGAPAAGRERRRPAGKHACTGMVIFPGSSLRKRRRGCISSRPHCASIRPMRRCFATFRPRWSGR